MHNKLLKNKGFVLSTVLMVMMVLSILFVSIVTITKTNTKQVVTQEDNLRAYYLARSGIDIAYTALMKETDDGEKNIQKFIDRKEETLNDRLALPNKDDPIGYVDIEVSKEGNEIKIHAKAEIANGPGKSSLSLYINKDNFSKTRWVKK